MNSKTLLILAALIISFASCKKDDQPDSQSMLDEELTLVLDEAGGTQGASKYLLPLDHEWSKIPQDPNNPITEEKVTLGKLLYHETAIGVNAMHASNVGKFSCASCHFASAGFQAGRHQGIGDGGVGFGINGEGRIPNPEYALSDIDVQPLRTPTTLNSAYQTVNLWNGQFGATGPNAGTEAQWTEDTPKENNHLGFEGVETQAIAGLSVHRMVLSDSLVKALEYDPLFDVAFPGVDASERYNRVQAGLAIAAYERTLIPNQAPFQLWLQGSSGAMTEQEKLGAILFFGKANCNNCHDGPNLANTGFEALGMKDLHESLEATYGTTASDEANLGRYSFTKNDEDKYKFKIPQLYNLADSPFFGHGASFRTVKDIVDYKNQAVQENPEVPESQLSEAFTPLGLTDEEVEAITAFIENGLHDPNLSRYQPESTNSGNCIPNSDDMSSEDLGCN